MNFAAQMRVGSLEILGALVLFGIIATRLRPAPAALEPAFALLRLTFEIREPDGAPARTATFTVTDGGRPCVIGRAADADVVLRDPEASRRHARLDLAGGVPYVSDLDSRNGTFLDGKQVGDQGIEIRRGDYIDVGNTRITITGMEPGSWT